jgi:hypothetical protein
VIIVFFNSPPYDQRQCREIVADQAAGIGAATINGPLQIVHTSWDPIPRLLESVEQKLTEACQPVVVED